MSSVECNFNICDILITIKAKELTKYLGICYSTLDVIKFGILYINLLFKTISNILSSEILVLAIGE